MKITGPIDNTTLYRKMVNKRDEHPIFFNMDDPYWQDFMAKNTKRQHLWKTPSFLAWNHKPRGLLGEVLDYKKME